MDKLFEWGIIKEGDTSEVLTLKVRNLHLINGDKRLLDGLQLEFIVGLWVKGSDKTLHEMRQEKMLFLESEVE